MKLVDVNISSFITPCAIFASMRTGGVFAIEDLLNMIGKRIASWDEVKVGDVVVWIKDEPARISLPTELTGLSVVSHHFTIGRHFGVIEENGFISDLSFADERPIIRLRRYSELSLPDMLFIHPENIK